MFEEPCIPSCTASYIRVLGIGVGGAAREEGRYRSVYTVVHGIVYGVVQGWNRM